MISASVECSKIAGMVEQKQISRAEFKGWFGSGSGRLKLSKLRIKAQTLGLNVTDQSKKNEIKKLMEELIPKTAPKAAPKIAPKIAAKAASKTAPKTAAKIAPTVDPKVDPKVERKTLPILTKYELAKILAKRAQEIADGQPITIQNPGTTSPKEIAMLEFRAGKTPKKIKRIWPDGTVEVWNVSELRSLF